MEFVQYTKEQWAVQEKALIDQFVNDDSEEFPPTQSAGEWDEWFREWHNDYRQMCPEDTPELP